MGKGKNIGFDPGVCPVASSYRVCDSSLSHRLKTKESNIIQPVVGSFQPCWLGQECEPRAVGIFPGTSHA